MSQSNSTPLIDPKPNDFIRGIGRLIEIQDVTPPPVKVLIDYIFESISATVQICSLSGEVLKPGVTIWDIDGEGTSVGHAITEARKQSEKLGPGLTVRVVKITSRRRSRKLDREAFYDKDYPDFELTSNPHKGIGPDLEEVVWSITKNQDGTIIEANADQDKECLR